VRDELLLVDDAIFDGSSSNVRSNPLNDGLVEHRWNNKLTALTNDVMA
jgi:hypothetical protein